MVDNSIMFATYIIKNNMFPYIVNIFTMIGTVGGMVFIGIQVKLALKESELNRKEHKANMILALEESALNRVQYKNNKKYQESLVAHDFIKRFNSPDFIQMSSASLQYFKEKSQNNKQIEEWIELESDNDLKVKIFSSMNFFDEMGLMFNNNLVNRTLISNFFKNFSRDYYNFAMPYINKRRQGKMKTQWPYSNWEKMNKNKDFYGLKDPN